MRFSVRAVQFFWPETVPLAPVRSVCGLAELCIAQWLLSIRLQPKWVQVVHAKESAKHFVAPPPLEVWPAGHAMHVWWVAVWLTPAAVRRRPKSLEALLATPDW
jgi:hypothetical protein